MDWELAAKAGKTAAPIENFQPSVDEGPTYTSPSIGLTAGQTARLSVVNNGDIEETETLSIVDSTGRTVATETLTIAPGTVGSLEYASPDDNLDIHGIIPCLFPASLQIINARTNRTVALVENFQPPLPEAILTSPSIRFTAGHTARLSVVNNGDIEATEALSIVNSTGRLVATETLSIAPGSVGSLAYASPGDNLDIHGVIPCVFPASLQIINARTNRTVALVENFQPPSLDKATLTSPSIGLVAGQTARLSVVNNGDIEATETLSIADSAGRVVATQTLSIAPGSVGSLDYASPGDIHGIVPCIIPASLQIINARTNKTVDLVENFLSGP